MYIPGELIIIFFPLIYGLIKGEVIWDGSQFTMKDQEPETPDLQKINNNYIISKKVEK